jgi:cytochrome c5
MSAHPDDQKVASTIKNAIAIFAASIGLVLIIFMLAQFAVGAYSGRARQDDPAMSAAAIAERLKPVGEVKVDAGAPAPVATVAPAPAAAAPVPAEATAVAAAAPAAASPAAAGGSTDQGKTTYEAVCIACHGAGVAGAPKAGDKAAWSARLVQGKEVLYASALKGKGIMPAKGGNPAVADDAVKAAVDYLVAQVK